MKNHSHFAGEAEAKQESLLDALWFCVDDLVGALTQLLASKLSTRQENKTSSAAEEEGSIQLAICRGRIGGLPDSIWATVFVCESQAGGGSFRSRRYQS
jgi:hypothetical protein